MQEPEDPIRYYEPEPPSKGEPVKRGTSSTTVQNCRAGVGFGTFSRVACDSECSGGLPASLAYLPQPPTAAVHQQPSPLHTVPRRPTAQSALKKASSALVSGNAHSEDHQCDALLLNVSPRRRLTHKRGTVQDLQAIAELYCAGIKVPADVNR
jgi:hypothetical protein